MPESIPVTDPGLDAPDGAVLRFPDGRIYERHGSTWEPMNDRCTSLSARWCPNHGDCTCDGDQDLDDLLCPLHGPSTSHADAYEVGR